MEKKNVLAIVAAVLFISVVSYFMFNKADSPSEDPILQFVSGTEYTPGQEGQVIVESRFTNGTSALSGGSCELSVWYPDKTLFLNVSGTMSVTGNEYVDFIVPNQTGVYEYQARCTYINGKNGTISKSFHVTMNEAFLKVFSDLNYIAESPGIIFAEARYVNGSSAMVDAMQCSFGVFYANSTPYVLGPGVVQGDGASFSFTTPWEKGVYGYQAICPLSNGVMTAGTGSFNVENGIRAVMPK